MAIIDGNKCDGCGKMTFDCYEEIGWLHFDGAVAIARHAGRRHDRQAQSDYVQDVQDFCGLDCLVKTLDRERDKRTASK